MDDVYQIFVLKYNLEDEKDNNVGELQNLYDDGWMHDYQSDELIHKGKVTIFITLIKSTFSEAV